MANPEHLNILKQGVKIWNRWRGENPDAAPDLRGSDLEGADLQKANLDKTDLRHALLRNAQMTGAKLTGAKFRGANLDGADLQNADLTEANFRRAEVRNVNLSGSDLADADFRHADLQGTSFNNVRMYETDLADVDLKQARDLHTVTHTGPSVIDNRTLSMSGSHIPRVFLQGCGLPENLIDYLPSLADQSAIEFYSCFISYSHGDKSFARRLHDQLQARGIRCWLDQHDMKPGDRILDVVNDAIRFHDKILLCCSEASLESWWVKDEIDKGLERERREGRDIIIPLNLDGYVLDGWESGQATTIRSRLAADFTGWETDNAKFEEHFERVVKALRTDDGVREKMSESKL